MQDERQWLRLPVVSASSEYLAMGYLMRRNILAYKAPPNNEGYDLICIHPDPRHKPKNNEFSQVRVQVKSRYATDCDRSFPIKEKSLDAFDFLVVVFLKIGKFYGRNNESEGSSFENMRKYFDHLTSTAYHATMGCLSNNFRISFEVILPICHFRDLNGNFLPTGG